MQFNSNTVQGILLAQSRLLRSIHELPTDAHQRRLLDPVAACRVSSEARSPLLLQGRGFLFWRNGALRLGLAPTPGTTDDDEVIVSLGPGLRFPSPVAVSRSALQSHLLALVEEAAVVKFAMPTLDKTTHLPNNVPGPAADAVIDWNGDDPLFAPIGQVFPLVPGAKLPTSLKLSDAVPAEYHDWDPAFVAWYQAHKFIYDHNSSKSLAGHSQVFDHTKFTMETSLPGLHHGIPQSLDYRIVDPGSSEHADFVLRWDDYIKSCTIAARGSEVISTAAAAPAASPGGATAQPFLERWCDLQMKTPTALAAQEAQHVKTQVVNNFRLFYGSTVSTTLATGAVTKEFVPAELTPEFERLLNMKSGTQATLYFQTAFRQFTQSLGEMNAYERNFEFDSRVCQHAFVAALQHFRFGTTSLNLNPEDVATGLSLFHFLPPQPGCVQYKSLLAANHTITLQEQMGEDKSKIAGKSSTLFFGGRIATIQDFHTTIATFMVFSKFAVKDFNYDAMPLVTQWIHKYSSILTRGAPLQWVNRHCAIAHLPTSILIDANCILQGCVELASNFKVVENMVFGSRINPALWTAVEKLADATCTALSNAIYSGNLGPFRDIPPLLAYLTVKPATKEPTLPAASGQKRSFHDDAGSFKGHDSKKPKPASNGKPGLLRYTGASGGQLPVPPDLKILCRVTARPSHLCSGWLYDGRSCARGTKCRFAHLTKLDTLDLEQQKSFQQWVHKTPNVEFRNPQNQG